MIGGVVVDFMVVTECNLIIDDGERYDGITGLLLSELYVLQSHDSWGTFGEGGLLLATF